MAHPDGEEKRVPPVLSKIWQGRLYRELETLRPRLYRMAYAWCHDTHLAEDLAQEAITKALSRYGQLREVESTPAWLFAILNNCWRDHLRARRELSDIDELDDVVLDPQLGPEELYESRQTTDHLRAAIASLPIAQRQVVTLVDLEGYSYADVARILEVPVGTIMSRLARARQALKERLMVQVSGNRHTQLRRVK